MFKTYVTPNCTNYELPRTKQPRCGTRTAEWQDRKLSVERCWRCAVNRPRYMMLRLPVMPGTATHIYVKRVSGSFSIYSERNYHLRNKWDIFLLVGQGILKYSPPPPSPLKWWGHSSFPSLRTTNDSQTKLVKPTHINSAWCLPTSAHWFGRTNYVNLQTLFEVPFRKPSSVSNRVLSLLGKKTG